ncbi:hypothetical protein MLD38_011323 [Melastoma candidum]|uniref:Uncharacterized protein n=1 Tax=Melastoma candidum TaxID=119954 RepID=A0ACB9R2P0_9MYRT|nr:hypothetical protein MLD38_011323 [Melastoma candidum]
MEVRRWIEGDETAKEMLERVFTQRSSLALPPPLHRIPLRSGDVVEIAGPSPSAKTQILLQAAVSCVLPKEWKGTYYGGLGQTVLYIDLDSKFDVHRLLQMLKHRIVGANGHSSSGCDEEIINMCMKRFFYTCCYDSFELLATLKTLHYRLQRENLALENHGHVIMMDSIGAFHWMDRACTSFVLEGYNRKSISFQNVMVIVVGELRKLLSVHSMVVICTKTANLGNYVDDRNFGKRSAPDNPDSLRDIGNGRRPVFREYMPSIWQSLVTHRIFVQALGDQVAVRKHRDGMVYSLEWSLPCLSFSDKFVVTDAGIALV